VTSVEEVSDVQTTIIGCVDSVLNELGESIGKVIYFHLEKNFGVNKKEILNQPEAFSKALHSIFGKRAEIIEELIAKKIQERFKLNLEPETSLVDAVQAVKRTHKEHRLQAR